jgi:raffinose/stachyose/melibiose transport system permease protein
MFETRHLRSKVILQLVLALMTIPFLLPLVEMVHGAFAGRGIYNFVVVWQTGVVPTFFKNSIILSASVIALVYVGAMTAAFGFSKLRVFGKEIYFWLMLVALTLLAVILPLAALQMPFAVLLARSFYDGIPTELVDAARIDGANLPQMFLRVILPLTKPIASAIVVLTLINAWNSYLLPLVFLQNRSNQVVTLLPQFFIGEFSNDQTKILAAAVMTAVPTVLAYILMQKNFERGLSAGALK